MSSLRLDQTIEKAFRLRVKHDGGIRGSDLHRETELLRDVRNGQATFTLETVITANRIKELLHRTPFRPFKLFLSDGSSHSVPHPEFAWVFGGRVFIGVAGRGGAGSNGQVKELSILHITRVEESGTRPSRK